MSLETLLHSERPKLYTLVYNFGLSECSRVKKLHNKTYHRDRVARLAHHIKNFNIKLFANANAAANAGGSTIAVPGLCPGELKMISDSRFY